MKDFTSPVCDTSKAAMGTPSNRSPVAFTVGDGSLVISISIRVRVTARFGLELPEPEA